jgi:hypothetical protein
VNHTRRITYIFLCAVPALAIILAAPRALRAPGVHQAIGGALFAAVVIAAWTLGARSIRGDGERERTLALAGGLLIVPFALISLLWTGLGPPWVATPAENVMRYYVLLVSSIAVSCGFVVLKAALNAAGENMYSSLGVAAALLGGATYVVWLCLLVGAHVAEVRDGQVPSAFASLSEVLEILLDAACLLTYLATAAFAASFGRTRWLERGPTRVYIAANLIALLCLVLRALSLPTGSAPSTPWYTQPGFVAGIPAIPYIMPFLLGVVLLRRAGDKQP